MQLYTPAYILSPKSDFHFKPFTDITEQTNINGSILFCSYCLSDGQRYLLTACCDDRGELLETCSINIEVPDRHKRKIQHARRIDLQKLWDFIMRIVTSTTMPWRIVIGRLGRLDHGELKSAYRNGQLVGWCLTHFNGSFGMMFTLPEVRQLGVSAVGNVSLALELFKFQEHVFCFVLCENEASYKMLEKLGYRSTCIVDWIIAISK
ncbi:unnamed protein product [Rotaria sp. Silwood1]|nr:unnamed protein product [Rotaria sp. Silwood1]